jgi:integrase
MGKNSKEASKRYYEREREKINKSRTLKRLTDGEVITRETFNKYGITHKDLTPEQFAGLSDYSKSLFPSTKILVKTKDLSIHWDEFEDLSEKSINRYQSSIKSLIVFLQVKNETDLFILLKDTDAVFNMLDQKTDTSKHNYLTTIVTICRHSDVHMKFLGLEFDVYYQEMMIPIYEDLKNLVKQKQERFVYDEEIPSWDTIMKLYHDIDQKEYLTQKHLLLATIVLIPPLRDNWGDVMFIYNDEDKLPKQNYYNITTQKLGLYDQKLSKKKGFIEIDVSNQLAELLILSLEHDPRTYVFENRKKNPYKSLSGLVKKQFGINLNEFRKSYTTYIIENDKIPWSQKVELMKATLHSSFQAVEEYYYPTKNLITKVDYSSE